MAKVLQCRALALIAVCMLACTMMARQVDSFTVPDSEWPWQPQQIEEFAAAAAAKPNQDLTDNIKFPSPWNTSVGNMYIIKLHPLSRPPVPASDYAIYNQVSKLASSQASDL